MKKRNLVLEKFYIMKCYSYLLPNEKTSVEKLCMRFNVARELFYQIVDENKEVKKWYYTYLDFLDKNYEIYNLKLIDILLNESIVIGKLLKIDRDNYFEDLKQLAEKGYVEAIYNLATFDEKQEKSFYLDKYKKLYELNYYRSFNDYVKYLDYGKDALNIVKKSLLKGYYSHIRTYKEIFFMIHKFDDIFKLPELKSELMFIIGGLIDLIITDNLEVLYEYFYFRKITIKHFDF